VTKVVAGLAILLVLAAIVIGRPIVIANRVPHTPPPDQSSVFDAQAVALPEAAHHTPASCDERVTTTAIPASTIAWSPQGDTVAVTHRVEGRDHVAVMRVADLQVHELGEGADPKWSASGTRLAVARGDRVVVIDATSAKEAGSVTPTLAGYAWSGETLLYWQDGGLHAWRDGRTGLYGAHVPDLTPLGADRHLSLSADGSRYAISSGTGADTVALYGDTADARLSAFNGATDVIWATRGADALLSFANGARILLTPNKHLQGSTGLPPLLALWSPDGSEALLGQPPSGATWSVIGWNGQKMGDSARVPAGFTDAAFSPTATYLAGIFDDGLRLYRCANDAAIGTGLISRARAKQIVSGTGEVLQVNLEDSKLIRWADLTSMLSGDWAVLASGTAALAPDAPVWLLMYAGEAKTPEGIAHSSAPSGPGSTAIGPTVSLVLYVLDARTGDRLAARVAVGTWWIGQPFESLTDRAPDATPHPFEAKPGATPPIQMPTPRPTATPSASRMGGGLAQLENGDGGWSIEFPDGWWPVSTGFGGVSLGTRDPDLGVTTPVQPPGWLWSAGGARIEIWANPDTLSASDYADKNFLSGGFSKLTAREQITVAGQSGVVIDRNEGAQPPDNHVLIQRYWILPTSRADRMLVISTSLGTSYIGEVEAIVRSLRLSTPTTVRGAPDITRDQVLSRWTTAKTAPARVAAKLVTFAEAIAAGQGNGLLRLDRDPDQLVWVVAVSAPPDSPGFFPSRGIYPTSGPRWNMYATPAYSTDQGAGLFGESGSNGDWPPFFDELTDRCC
jgi:hypothetical protein